MSTLKQSEPSVQPLVPRQRGGPPRTTRDQASREGGPPRNTRDQASRAFYLALLLATVASIAVPAILLQPDSRIFVLKLAVVVLLGSLPGLLYIQFVRFKGPSLYDEYVLNLFRLEIDQYCNLPAPPRHTDYYLKWKQAHRQLKNPGTDNLYRRKFEVVYGEQAVSTRGMFAHSSVRPARTEGFYPVLLATALVSIGWVLVVQPELFRSTYDLLGGSPITGQPEVAFEALVYGFLGAYWFILQDLVRRYFRQDLKTAAYLSASTRIVVVILVVSALSLLQAEPATPLPVVAFLIGIFPQLGVQLLKAGVSKGLGRMIPALTPDHPLTDLEGMTLWDQARLLEEGVEDTHALATANLVDLMLGTRLPLHRLIDWLDQALLFLHVPETRGQRYPREELRGLGIRTATDLLDVAEDAAPGTAMHRRLALALSRSDTPDADAVETTLICLAGHPNLVHVHAYTSRARLDWPTNPRRPCVETRTQRSD